MTEEIPVFYYNQPLRDKFPSAWWTAKPDEVAGACWSKMKAIREDQKGRREDFLRFARLYANKDFEQFIGGLSAGFLGRRLTFNVSRACVDTACAKISKSKTRPRILTNKGNWSQKKELRANSVS